MSTFFLNMILMYFFIFGGIKKKKEKKQEATHSEGDFTIKENANIEILNLYKPKSYIFEKFIPFIPKKEYLSPFSKKEIAYQSTCGRFLSTKKVLLLLEEYKKIYDFIILTRTDLLINSLPEFSTLNKDKIYSKYTKEDFIWIMNMNHVNLFKNMFDNLDNLYDETKEFYPESFFKCWFKMNNIEENIIGHPEISVGIIR